MIIQSDKKTKGEYEGLKAIQETKTVMVPRPIVIGRTSNHVQHFLVMDYLNLTVLNNVASAELGRKLADLHLHNLQHKRSLVFIIRFFEILSLTGVFMKPKYDGAIKIGHNLKLMENKFLDLSIFF